MNKQTPIGILILVSIFILACGGSVVPTAITSSSSPIVPDITFTGNEVKEITSEDITQPNCNGTAEVENQVERSRAIEHILETSGEFTVDAEGQVGIPGTDVKVGAAVAAQLGISYGTTEIISRSLTVKASPGSNMVHTIKQTEIWQVGNAKVVINGKETIIPFRFRNDFSVELISSRNDGCGNQPISPTATETSETGSSIPTPQPPTFTPSTPFPIPGTIPIDVDILGTYDDFLAKATTLDLLPGGRMRLNLYFWNKSSQDRYFFLDIYDCAYLADTDNGTQYKVLDSTLRPTFTHVQPQVKVEHWIEFNDAVSSGGRNFTVDLCSLVSGASARFKQFNIHIP